MATLTWNEVGGRIYEAGIDRGVLYVDGVGVPWNGLQSVKDSSSGGDPKTSFIDGQKILAYSRDTQSDLAIDAYMSPPEFDACDGTGAIRNGLFVKNQFRKKFDFSYRSRIGNDIDGVDHGYKIHLAYNCLAKPADREYKTLGEAIDALTLSWDVSTTPVAIPESMRSSVLIIDSTKAYSWAIEALEDVLYGTATTPPRMPTPEEVVTIFEDNSILKITDNGDGTWTAEGPDSIITMLDITTFQIDWSSAIMLNPTTYEISSL